MNFDKELIFKLVIFEDIGPFTLVPMGVKSLPFINTTALSFHLTVALL